MHVLSLSSWWRISIQTFGVGRHQTIPGKMTSGATDASLESKEVDGKVDDSNVPNETGRKEDQVEGDDVESEEEDEAYVSFKSNMGGVLKELEEKGDIMTDFTVEFEKLVKSMASSHENELRVDRKCRKLSSEIAKVRDEIKGNEDEIADIGRRKLKNCI